MEHPKSAGDGAASPIGPPDGIRDEFDLVEGIRRRAEAVARPPEGDTWIGDDAAVLARVGPGRLLLATDLVVDGVHTDTAWATPADIGAKAVAVTVSDLAAMGGVCDAVLLSVVAPPGTDVEAVAGGAAEAAARVGGALVGGDLSSGGVLTVSVAALGHLPPPDDLPALLRSGARPGDTLVVTGALGAAAAGLRLLEGGWADARVPADGPAAVAVGRQLRPPARLVAGRVARTAGARAAVDLSDGLSVDAGHLAVASGVGVDLTSVPVADAATVDEAVHGGEDYELLVATADPEGLAVAFAAAGLDPPLRVGTCDEGVGTVRLHGQPLAAGGWRHRF